MKNIFKIIYGRQSDKHIVVYYEDGKLKAELWPVEWIWDYIQEAYRNGNDPLDLMHIEQNEYALGKGEVYGLKKERNYGLGRKY